MPIKIPNDLPATSHLEEEGLVVMKESDAVRQDIRPMRIAMLNLMPHKIKTEIQLARLIGGTPLQVELTLVGSHTLTPNGSGTTISGTGATAGAVITVNTTLGSIVTADADPNYAGVQVVAGTQDATVITGDAT